MRSRPVRGLQGTLVAIPLILLICSPAKAEDWFRVLQTVSDGAAVAVPPSSPGTVYFASRASSSGLLTFYRSRDAGNTWAVYPANVEPATSLQGLAVDPSDPLVVYATTSSGVLKSTDGAEHWTTANVGLPEDNYVYDRVVVNPRLSSTLYVGTNLGVYESLDAGGTWFASHGLADVTGPAVQSVASDPSDASVLYAGTTTWVFKTIDGGASWFPTNSFVKARSIVVDSKAPSVVYAAGGYKMTGGPTCFFDKPGCSGAAIDKSVDGGTNWTRSLLVPSAPPFTLAAVDPASSSVVWAGHGDGLRQSLDGGSTWTIVQDGLTEPPVSIAVAPCSPTIVFVGTNSGLFRKTFTDDGRPMCGDCVHRLCLQGRFRAGADFLPHDGRGASAAAVPLASNTGAFWFFDPSNLELVVKVLDGRSVNGKWWVFYGSLTNVEFTLTVTDTQTGAVKTYVNAQGQLASVADTSAF